MIGKLIPILALIAVTFARKPFEGVDPNTLKCDPRGLVYLLLPHYTDCHKFYMCAHGREVEFTCAGGLIFDFELQTCNWNWATTCILRTKPDESNQNNTGEEDCSGEQEGSGAEEGSGDDSVEWFPEGSGDENEEINAHEHEDLSHFSNIVINCADPEDATRQVPYKGDCQRYWRCQNGTPQVLYCTDGLFFNAKTQQCDFEANVSCLVELEDELTGEFIVY